MTLLATIDQADRELSALFARTRSLNARRGPRRPPLRLANHPTPPAPLRLGTTTTRPLRLGSDRLQLANNPERITP